MPAARAADWLFLFADRTRLLLLSRLLHGPAASGELAVAVGRPRVDASAHLKVMLGGGLVTRERSGNRVFYSLAGAVTRSGKRVTLHGPGVRMHVETGAE